MPEPNEPSTGRPRVSVGLLCIALGCLPVSIALGILPVDQSQVHAPMWVFATSGIVFVLGGCMIVVGSQSRANDLLAGIVCLLFGVLGTWTAVLGGSDGFSGGLWFLSNEANVRLGRWIFGVGALFCFAIAIYAFRLAMGSGKRRSADKI